MAGEQFLSFGLPIFNTFLAGQIGVIALNTHIVAVQWILLIHVTANITSIGGSILIAQSTGGDNLKNSNVVLLSSLLLALGSGSAVTALMLFSSPFILKATVVNPEVLALGIDFLRISALSFPMEFILITSVGCMQGAGDAKTPLALVLITNAIHLILATVMTFGVGPIDGLGLIGVATATVISRAIGAVGALVLLVRGIPGLQLTFGQVNLRTMNEIWSIGRAVGAERLALRLAQLVNVRLVAKLGPHALAAYAVSVNSLSFVLLIGMGFMAATLALTGQQVGAGFENRIVQTAHRTLRLAWVLMGSLSISFFLWPQAVLGLFTKDTTVLSLAQFGLRLLVLGIPFEAINQVYTGVIRGVGDTRYPMWFTTLGHWLIRIPLIFILIEFTNLGLRSVWLAMVLEMAFRASLNSWRLRSNFWLQNNHLQSS